MKSEFVWQLIEKIKKKLNFNYDNFHESDVTCLCETILSQRSATSSITFSCEYKDYLKTHKQNEFLLNSNQWIANLMIWFINKSFVSL